MSATTKHIQPGYTTIHAVLVCEARPCRLLKNAFGAEVTHTPTPDAKGQFHAEATNRRRACAVGNGFFFPTPRWRQRSILRPRCRCDLQTRGEPRRQGDSRAGRHDLGRSRRRSERYLRQYVVDCDQQEVSDSAYGTSADVRRFESRNSEVARALSCVPCGLREGGVGRVVRFVSPAEACSR